MIPMEALTSPYSYITALYKMAEDLFPEMVRHEARALGLSEVKPENYELETVILRPQTPQTEMEHTTLLGIAWYDDPTPQMITVAGINRLGYKWFESRILKLDRWVPIHSHDRPVGFEPGEKIHVEPPPRYLMGVSLKPKEKTPTPPPVRHHKGVMVGE